jgi:hypothetical protein
MKHLSLLFLILVITSCSNEWEELGFSKSQEEKAKEMGFENPLDYKEALDLDIKRFSVLSAYRRGGFNDKVQFAYALRFNLISPTEVKNHIISTSCVDTPSYGQVCTANADFYELREFYSLAKSVLLESNLNIDSYDEFGPRLEYQLTKSNRHIDNSSIEMALDCSSNHRQYRTVFVFTEKKLIPDTQWAKLDDDFYFKQSNTSELSPRTHALMISTFKENWSNFENKMRPEYKLVQSSLANVSPDSLTFYLYKTIRDGWRYIDIDRKTGLGKRNGNVSHAYAKDFECKAFEGGIKTYLKEEVLKAPMTKVIAKQIEDLNKKKAEELAKKKKEEERAKLENKF